MNWETALDLAVARTGHERFRVLCSDAWPDHVAYRRLVLRMAGVKVDSSQLSVVGTNLPADNRQLSTDNPSRIPLAESLPLLQLVNSCPYRSRDAACGCSGHRCALRGDFGLVIGDFGFQSIENPQSKIQNHGLVNHLECMECVKRHDNSRPQD